MRILAFAAISAALIEAPSAAQIAVQSTQDMSPRCEVLREGQFHARRVADIGSISGPPSFLGDASRLAIVAGDGAAELLDASTGEHIADLYPSGAGAPSLLATSPDGEIALWSNGRGAVDMRRARTGEAVSQLGALQRGDLLFSPDGSRLIARADGVVTVLDGKTGDLIGAPVEVDPVAALEFSESGEKLIVHSADSSDAAINLRTGAPAYSVAAGVGEQLEFDDESTRALLLGSTGWKLLDPENAIELAGGNGEEARFSAGGAYVLAEGQGGVRIIDARTGRLAARLGKLASTPSRPAIEAGLLISPDDRTVITRSQDGIARLWDLTRGRGLAELGLFSIVRDDAREDPRLPREFQFTPDGVRLVTRDLGGHFTIWDARTGQRVSTIGQFTNQDYLWLADDGAFAVAILADGATTLWNTRSGWRIANMGRFTPDPAETRFLLSPDRRVLLISSRQKTELWDIERGQLIGQRAGQIHLTDVTFSANGAWLALRPNAGESAFEIWNARTGGRAGEARPADRATFYTIGGEDVLLTRSAAGFALWHMKRGERTVSCQFTDPGLALMDVFAAGDALHLVLDVGGGQSELWNIERR